MRILVLSDLPQFVTGGAEKQAANLIEAWLDAGHEVTCFGRRMGRGPVTFGKHRVPVRRIRTLQSLGRAGRALSYFLSLALLLIRHRRRFDVVYTRFLGEAALTVCLLKHLRLIKVAAISTPANTGGMGDAHALVRLPFTRQLVRLLERHCDAINLIAPAMADELRDIGFSGANFSHIPNGVAVRDDPPDIAQRPFQFLAVGRLAQQKGYDTLIEAMATIRSELSAGCVRIAGDGPDRMALQAAARRHEVDFAITWLGELPHAAVLRELEQARIFLLPSRYEGMSNAGLEAMERGLALLMSRCGGLDTYIDAEMGWVVPPGNTRELADAMHQALTTPIERLASMGRRNRTTTREQFGLPVIAGRYLQLFRQHTTHAMGTRKA